MNNLNNSRSDKRQKDRSKMRKNGPYSSKGARQKEQNMEKQNVRSNINDKNNKN